MKAFYFCVLFSTLCLGAPAQYALNWFAFQGGGGAIDFVERQALPHLCWEPDDAHQILGDLAFAAIAIDLVEERFVARASRIEVLGRRRHIANLRRRN